MMVIPVCFSTLFNASLTDISGLTRVTRLAPSITLAVTGSAKTKSNVKRRGSDQIRLCIQEAFCLVFPISSTIKIIK